MSSFNAVERHHSYDPTTPASDIITALVREVFGTYFLEDGNWTFPEGTTPIGRTYFADRKKQKVAINEKTVDNLILIYELAFDNKSSHNPVRVSENLVRVLKEQFNIDVSYAMFFDDDTEALRRAKTRTLRAMIREIASSGQNRPLFCKEGLDENTKFIRYKLLSSIVRHSHGTYTETVIRAMDKRIIQTLL